MPKLLLPAVLALSVMSAAFAETASAPAIAPAIAPAGGAACTAKPSNGGDIRIVTCTLPAEHAHRFTANFSGGHDDTSASLAVTLDGQATNCDAGSKMRLFAEDGDISLHCRITATGDASAPHALVVTVLWSHAQFRDYAFAAE